MPHPSRTNQLIRKSQNLANHATNVAVAADVLAIPVTHGTVRKTTGADAEACTLADGTYEGQLLRITLAADGGGNATISPATPAGYLSFVLADLGDTVVLRWDSQYTIPGWRIESAFGATAPPAINFS